MWPDQVSNPQPLALESDSTHGPDLKEVFECTEQTGYPKISTETSPSEILKC